MDVQWTDLILFIRHYLVVAIKGAVLTFRHQQTNTLIKSQHFFRSFKVSSKNATILSQN